MRPVLTTLALMGATGTTRKGVAVMDTSLEVAVPPVPDGEETGRGHEGPPWRLDGDLVVEANFGAVPLTTLGLAATK